MYHNRIHLAVVSVCVLVAGCQKSQSTDSGSVSPIAEMSDRALVGASNSHSKELSSRFAECEVRFSEMDIKKPGQRFRNGEQIELSGGMKWIEPNPLAGGLKVFVISFSAQNAVPVMVPIICGSAPPTDGRPYALIKNLSDQRVSLHGNVLLPPTVGKCEVVLSIVSAEPDASGTETQTTVNPLFQADIQLDDN